MAEKGVQLDQEILTCSICLDLLMNPVTIPCGHSYCEKCIKTHWSKVKRNMCSCPQCRKTFTQRPDLVKNTMLAALAEQLKKMELQAAPADLCYAGPEDVACDVCSGRKLKALKSCLVCVASYCKTHLQPHYESPAFKKHKLVEPGKELQENLCPRHDEVMKMFCLTDQQLICYLCSVDEHKGHNTVSAASERAEKQQELDKHQKNIWQRIQGREKDLQLLQQEVEIINQSADKAMHKRRCLLDYIISLMEERHSEVNKELRSQQRIEVSRVKELQEKLEQEIAELKTTDAELKKLSQIEDHKQFLQSYSSLPALSESGSSVQIHPPRQFEVPAEAELRTQQQYILRDKWSNVPLSMTDGGVSLSPLEPKYRDDFLKLSCDLTLDPNTANTNLVLSQSNRRATIWNEPQSYPSNPERFTTQPQAMSRRCLPARCYFEVDCGKGGVGVAVTYRSILRTGCESDCAFGHNDKSWMIDFHSDRCEFWHNWVRGPVRCHESSTIGVYVDQRAGVLSFYSVSMTMTLLHRVQTTFTEPLYAGLWLLEEECFAEIR